MRKTLLILMLLLLVLVPAAGVSNAQPAEDGDALATYFPQDTLVYASLRVDDAMFTELDGVIAQLSNNLPGMLPAGINSKDLLDLLLINQTGLSSQILLDWMGDSVAVGLPSLDALMAGDMNALEVVLAAEVADRTAAEDFMRLATSNNPNIVENTTEDYTIFTDDSSVTALVSDEVLLLGVNADVKGMLNQKSSLADNETYQSTIANLPGEGYLATIYADAQAINEAQFASAMAEMAGTPAEGPMNQLFSTLQNQGTTGFIAMGLGVVDNRNLIMDITATVPDNAATNATSLMRMNRTPVNLDFAGNVPGGAELVVQSSDMGGQMIATFAALDELTPIYQEMIQSVLSSDGMEIMIEDLLREMNLDSTVNAEDALAFLQGVDIGTIKLGGVLENLMTQTLAGFTGLNLRNDVLTVLDGDNATWVDVLPLQNAPLPITVDVGFASGSSDPAGTAHIVEKIAEAAGLYGVPHEVSAVGNGQAVALGEVIQGVLADADAVPADILAMPELDLLVGANDDLFVIGMRPGASFALNGDATGSLFNNPAYQYAAENLFLDEPTSVVFINARALMDALPALAPMMGSSDMQTFSMIGSVVESMTITSTMDESLQATRLTVTIPSEPYTVDLSGTSATITSNVMTSSPYDGLSQSVSEDGFAQLGDDGTAVLVEMYGDFSCPHCGTFHATYSEDLVALAQSGDVTLRYIPMLTANGPNADVAAAAAYCAGEQGQFWNFHDRLYDWQHEFGANAFDTGRMEEGLTALGVDLDTFFDCYASGRGTNFLNQGIQKARDAGVTGTPTVFVNGVLVNPTDMLAAINDALPK